MVGGWAGGECSGVVIRGDPAPHANLVLPFSKAEANPETITKISQGPVTARQAPGDGTGWANLGESQPVALGLSGSGGWVARGLPPPQAWSEVTPVVILRRVVPLPLLTDKCFTDMFVNEGGYS